MSEQAPDSPSVRVTETTEIVIESHDSSHGASDVRDDDLPDVIVRELKRIYGLVPGEQRPAMRAMWSAARTIGAAARAGKDKP